jgi:UDP-N-acetylmuramyl pentapeptide synthase
MRADATAIVNADDPNCVAQSARFAGVKLRFALQAAAEFRASNVRGEAGRASYTLSCPAGEAPIHMSAPGLHLVDDGLCAAAAAFASGALGPDPFGAIAKGLESFAGVPGRGEHGKSQHGTLRRACRFDLRCAYCHARILAATFCSVVRSKNFNWRSEMAKS